MSDIKLPALLDVPPKLHEFIVDFANYRSFLLEGGRNGGKSQAVGRFLLYAGDVYKGMKIVCGREVQERIEESVYSLLKELIDQYSLPYRVFANKIRHVSNGTEFSFRGFKDLTSEEIKGLQGVDILWVDEAQSLSLRTVQTIIPTIRKETAKLIFTMNRFVVSDPVYEEFSSRSDCLHLHITYLDNPFCPHNQKIEAENMLIKSPKDYDHIWLGLPLSSAEDFLFDSAQLDKAYSVEPWGDMISPARVLAIDFASKGEDKCVGTILDRMTNTHWRPTAQIGWQEQHPMVSTGKIVAMIGEYKPDLTVLDCDGTGYIVWGRLDELGLDIKQFYGSTTEGIDKKHYANARAEGYYTLKEYFDNEWICLDRDKDKTIVKQLEKIRMKYRSTGVRLIQSKDEMRSEGFASPDEADSLMMGIYAITKFLGRSNPAMQRGRSIQRVSGTRRGSDQSQSSSIRRVGGSRR